MVKGCKFNQCYPNCVISTVVLWSANLHLNFNRSSRWNQVHLHFGSLFLIFGFFWRILKNKNVAITNQTMTGMTWGCLKKVSKNTSDLRSVYRPHGWDSFTIFYCRATGIQFFFRKPKSFRACRTFWAF